jgi:hypothetical protein
MSRSLRTSPVSLATARWGAKKSRLRPGDQLRLRELLAEVQDRIEKIAEGRDADGQGVPDEATANNLPKMRRVAEEIGGSLTVETGQDSETVRLFTGMGGLYGRRSQQNPIIANCWCVHHRSRQGIGSLAPTGRPACDSRGRAQWPPVVRRPRPRSTTPTPPQSMRPHLRVLSGSADRLYCHHHRPRSAAGHRL